MSEKLIGLPDKAKRALKLLSEDSAVEQQGYELQSLKPLVRCGYAAAGPWERCQDSPSSTPFFARRVYITPAGRLALQGADHV